MDAQRKRPLEDLILEHGVATEVQLVLDDIPANYEKLAYIYKKICIGCTVHVPSRSYPLSTHDSRLSRNLKRA